MVNFDPNNYAEFYQEALQKGEDLARSIASQTTELAKGSAMEETRDQGFALGQASKYGDTQNYRDKIINDIEQKSELDRSKMLADQSQKEQANVTNQQSLLSTIGSALLQMKLAKEAASSGGGGGGGGSYPSSMTAADLAKLGIGGSATGEVPSTATAPTKKEESGFWKVMNWLPGSLIAAGTIADATGIGAVAGIPLQIAGGVGALVDAIHDVTSGKPAKAREPIATAGGAKVVGGKVGSILSKLFKIGKAVAPAAIKAI